jgi:hypothetical protein
MNNDWKVEYNASAEKHNKRVKSIREVRLPKSCTAAIDESIKAMDHVHDQVCEGMYHGYNALMMDDIIQLHKALYALKREFEYQELRS